MKNPMTRRTLLGAAGALGLASVTGGTAAAAPATLVARPTPKRGFNPMETTVADIHRAYHTGQLTCRELVQSYLDRIAAYDKQGPAVNSMLFVNPRALELADQLDRMPRGMQGPLHGIPVVLKDNYDTMDMPTTGASAALAGAQPSRDATVVARMRQAGALIIGKANLQEFALGGVTVSSLGGQTKNPYDLTRTPGGSSGGTAVALAANFAAIGAGSDTVNSLRSPASACDVVGFRPTSGLVSRAGVIPVSFTQDVVGPMARTVADAARLLDVMAGYDPADPITADGVSHQPGTYSAFLDRNEVRGVRIGVLDTLFGTGPESAEVNALMEEAIKRLERLGATIVHLSDPALDSAALSRDLDVQVYEYASAINDYLGMPDVHAPVHSLEELIASGKCHPDVQGFLNSAAAHPNGLEEPEYQERLLGIEAVKQRVLDVMARHEVDVLTYPHQQILAVPIGESNQAKRNGILAALSSCPAITLPAGLTAATAAAPSGVPVGIEFLGRPWSEPQLIGVAHGFEQASGARQLPDSVPALS
ncbi:amidase family protein [Saccharopolyspora sp. K220]|uniref:amidase n=1 Tax=Saccharopolyspora soli TaxID=2926618 RepID=UPI001F56047E|nr:amidase family protein [Saccharopolyspora soli]MCI2422317.1 amidase family protein [Saccharopolyspora soli]